MTSDRTPDSRLVDVRQASPTGHSIGRGLHALAKESADTPDAPAPAATPLPIPSPPRAPPPGTAPRDRATPEGDGLDPTRYGDWEKNGRCIDF